MAPRKSASSKKISEAAAAATGSAPATPDTTQKTGNDAIDTLVSSLTTVGKPITPTGKTDYSYTAIVKDAWNDYVRDTPRRLKWIDVFLVFLMYVGVVQFAYCALVGNYPFNAFLAGFGATVGQFVLTAGLRIQTNKSNQADFPAITPERAFGDYVFGSILLHFAVVNFLG